MYYIYIAIKPVISKYELQSCFADQPYNRDVCNDQCQFGFPNIDRSMPMISPEVSA